MNGRLLVLVRAANREERRDYQRVGVELTCEAEAAMFVAGWDEQNGRCACTTPAERPRFDCVRTDPLPAIRHTRSWAERVFAILAVLLATEFLLEWILRNSYNNMNIRGHAQVYYVEASGMRNANVRYDVWPLP